MTKQDQSIAFLRSLRAADVGVTIYQDTIDEVLCRINQLQDAVRQADKLAQAVLFEAGAREKMHAAREAYEKSRESVDGSLSA
jgi:hypothetical protein